MNKLTMSPIDISLLQIDSGRVILHLVKIEAGRMPGRQNFALHAHDETYLGKDCRVSGYANAAWLIDLETAQAFASARREHLRELYGADTTVEPSVLQIPTPNTDRQRQKLFDRVLGDTARVRARIQSGVFAPNISPPEGR